MYKKILEYNYNSENQKIILSDSIEYRCRFCGRTLDKEHFRKEAHAVSEGIGNKSIITSYECDECNQHFADCEENELGNLFCLYKAVRGKIGKKGKVKLHGVKIDYTKEHDYSIEVDYEKNKNDIIIEFDQSMNPCAINYAKKTTVNFRMVYGAFIKFALSVVPEDISHELERGYFILRNGKDFPSYRCKMIFFYEEIENPGIAIYKRVDEAKGAKYYCTVDAYQVRYIVPLEFDNPIDRIPLELFGNISIPTNVKFDICDFDCSDIRREIKQCERVFEK